MNVMLFSFAKKKNSTRQPTLTEGTTLSCQLKDDTSLMNPVIVINPNSPGFPTPFVPSLYNYVYIPSFTRYYFVSDWAYTLGVWECSLTVDVLASFKTAIGLTSAYVVRSSHSYNGEVMDGLYPTTAETVVNSHEIESIYRPFFTGGYFIVGIINNNAANGIGAVTYYQLTQEQMCRLKGYMMSDVFITQQNLNIQTVTDVIPTELLKTLYNPYQYIASCEWFPFDISRIPSNYKSLEDIQFGWWRPDSNTEITGYRLNNAGIVLQVEAQRLPINGPPASQNGRGKYLDHSPYADRMLYYVPFGSIPLNDDSFERGDFARVEIQADMIFGDAVLSVYHDRPITDTTYNYMGLIARQTAKLSVPIQLAQTTVDIESSLNAGAIQGVAGIAQGLVSGRGLFGALKDGIDGILDTASNPVGQLATSGQNGSLAQYANRSYYIQRWKIVAEENNAQLGRPLYATRTLNTIPGYIMCAKAEVAVSCMDMERDTINNYLNNGFFYE